MEYYEDEDVSGDYYEESDYSLYDKPGALDFDVRFPDIEINLW